MKILFTLFILFMFFPIPLKFYIYYYNNFYYIKLYNFTLFNNTALKNKKEKKKSDNNPPIKKKSKKASLKLTEFKEKFKKASYKDMKDLIGRFYYSKFKPILISNSTFEYSLNDAAKTAINFGILSSIPSISHFILNVIFKTPKYKFNIIPVFEDKLILKFETKSIIFISFANIIFMAFILLKYFFEIIHENKNSNLSHV